jgi:ferrous iron transport protein A
MSTAAQMKPGQRGLVVSIEGGRGMGERLRAMGLRPGVMITKTSGQPLRGPVTLRLGSTEIAVGHRMAQRILVEVEE